jgi:hypothetical protein
MIGSMADFQLAVGHYVYVPANGNTTVTVLVDVGDVTTGGALAGDLPIFEFDDGFDFSAVGASSATEITSAATGTIDGEEMRIARSAPTITKVTSGVSSDLANGEQTLYKWTVKADAADDIAIKQMAFNVDVTTGSVSDFKLLRNGVDVSSSSQTIDINNDGNGLGGLVGSIEPTSGGLITNTNDIVFIQWLDASDAGEEIITAGTTVTYELKALVSGTSGTDTVSTSLRSDTEANAGNLYYNGTFVDVDCDTAGNCGDSNFVWSDLSLSPHDNDVTASSSNDWLDGYLVEGLSSAGSQTLS